MNYSPLGYVLWNTLQRKLHCESPLVSTAVGWKATLQIPSTSNHVQFHDAIQLSW